MKVPSVEQEGTEVDITPLMNPNIVKALAIIARRKELAKEGNGLMQYSEYEGIERLLLGIQGEQGAVTGPCDVKGPMEVL